MKFIKYYFGFAFCVLNFWMCLATPQKKFTLITVLYNETHAERAQEYIACLEKNLTHNSIETIHVVYDTAKDDGVNVLLNYIKSKPVTIDYINGRCSFAHLFKLANDNYPERSILISNADIYFNQTLELLEGIDLTNKFLAFTRWNVKKDGSLEIFKQYWQGRFLENTSARSQDVWAFCTPLKQFINDDIKLGIMGCDVALGYEASKAGFKLYNPCLSVQCCHLHLVDIRNYDATVRPYPHYSHFSIPWVTIDAIKESGTKSKEQA